jgi:hypothetical protein
MGEALDGKVDADLGFTDTLAELLLAHRGSLLSTGPRTRPSDDRAPLKEQRRGDESPASESEYPFCSSVRTHFEEVRRD